MRREERGERREKREESREKRRDRLHEYCQETKYLVEVSTVVLTLQ